MSGLEFHLALRRGNFELPVELSLPSSGTTVFFGNSGTGKTSLLRAIAGLDRHEDALVSVNGTVWQNEKQFLPTHRRKLGYLFQDANLFPHLDVMGNLRFAARLIKADTAVFDRAIEQLGISDLLSKRPAQLSGGEKQKAALARVLLQQPALLLLDEPFSAIDEGFRREFLPKLKALLNELAVPTLYVTHASTELGIMADTLVYFRAGQKPAVAATNTLLTDIAQELARRADAETYLDATVIGIDPEFGLYQLDCGGSTLHFGGQDLSLGQAVRLRIQAQDVSLATARNGSSSILNILPVTVAEMADITSYQCLVKLQLGQQTLLSRITRKSAAHLRLHVGMSLYAQIKGVAVLQ